MTNMLDQYKINTDNTLIEDEKLLDLPQYIDRPEYVTNRNMNYILQAVGWCIFMLFLLPIITILLWWFGIHNIYSYVLEEDTSITHFNIINIAIIILILGGVLLSWASYNWIRFYNNERRTSPANIEVEQLAQQFLCNKEDVIKLRESSNITLYYDDEGHLNGFK